MTNNEQAIREFAEKWGYTISVNKKGELYNANCKRKLLSDLTALISEHYVSREEYDEEKKSNSLLHKAMVTAEKGGHDKAMEEISEHYYPKEFVEWYIRGQHGFGRIEASGELLFVNFYKGSNRKYTLDELFNYWKENEQ